MLYVKTKLKTSLIPDAGMGLFADQFIPKDTLIWKFDDGYDIRVLNLPDNIVMRDFIKTYGYLQDDGIPGYVICMDNARFINHSDDTLSNIRVLPDGTCYAKKNININDEITCDYNVFCAEDTVMGWKKGDGPK